ncbi:hypothetical protein [Nonomuraea sp. NPDC049784]|uniref:hypothetical protein n=1 Tax=Nonomuraea sp. NPDC049784 TaxID=3154361 RepID=UPI0033F2D732
MEVAEEGPPGHLHLLQQRVQRSVVESAFAEERDGGVDQCLASTQLFAFAQGGGLFNGVPLEY